MFRNQEETLKSCRTSGLSNRTPLLRGVMGKSITPSQLAELSGCAPAQIAALDLSHRELTDVSELACCHGLQKLTLDGNCLESLDGVEELHVLQTLSAQHNSVATLDGLRGLPKLAVLNVSHNALSSLGTALRTCTNLRAVLATDNRLRRLDLGAFRLLKQLTTVVASRNAVAELTDADKLAQLRKLSLSHNALRALGPMPGTLTELRLNHNKLATLPESLGQCGRLRLLDVANNLFKAEDHIAVLKELSGLRNLGLRGNPVAEAMGATYRGRVRHWLPGIQVLDGAKLKLAEVNRKVRFDWEDEEAGSEKKGARADGGDDAGGGDGAGGDDATGGADMEGPKAKVARHKQGMVGSNPHAQRTPDPTAGPVCMPPAGPFSEDGANSDWAHGLRELRCDGNGASDGQRPLGAPKHRPHKWTAAGTGPVGRAPGVRRAVGALSANTSQPPAHASEVRARSDAARRGQVVRVTAGVPTVDGQAGERDRVVNSDPSPERGAPAKATKPALGPQGHFRGGRPANKALTRARVALSDKYDMKDKATPRHAQEALETDSLTNTPADPAPETQGAPNEAEAAKGKVRKRKPRAAVRDALATAVARTGAAEGANSGIVGVEIKCTTARCEATVADLDEIAHDESGFVAW